jgi:hypothetical protein
MAKQIKKYVVIDQADDDTVVCCGTLDAIHIHLENEYIDKMGNDWDTDPWVNSLTVYELTKPARLKYTRSKLEIK